MITLIRFLVIILCLQFSFNLITPVPLLAKKSSIIVVYEEDDDDDEEDDDDDEEDDDDDEEDDDDDEEDDDDGEGDDDGEDDEGDDDEKEIDLTPTENAPSGSEVELELEQSSSGELKLEIKVKGLPIGVYDVVIAGVNRATVNVTQSGSSTKGKVEFESFPDDSDELILNFEIQGQLVEIKADGLVFFSAIAPYVSSKLTDGSEIESEYDEEDGELEIESESSGTELSPDGSKVKIKLESESDGKVEFEVEVSGLEVGSYDLNVSGTKRGTIQVIQYFGQTSGEIEFESPAGSDDLPLNFPVSGEPYSITKDGVIYFQGNIPMLIANPASFPVSLYNASVIPGNVLPDPNAETLNNGWKRSFWLGVHNDSSFPIIEHCVLGTVEYRTEGDRDLLVSLNHGVLEILRSGDGSDRVVFLSTETGKLFSLSNTTEDCSILMPDLFFDESTQSYAQYLVPEETDVMGFYNIAYEATIDVQEKSAEAIRQAQIGNFSAAYVLLNEASYLRGIVAKNVNNTIRAVNLTGIDVAFWTDAANQLILIANNALSNAQVIVSELDSD